jgi:hypothetical protein
LAREKKLRSEPDPERHGLLREVLSTALVAVIIGMIAVHNTLSIAKENEVRLQVVRLLEELIDDKKP